MSWTNYDLTTVNPNMEIIPSGAYTFQILGAKYDEKGAGRLEVTATIVTEGDFTGRKMYFSFPDPDSISSRTGKKNDWSAKALKRLEQSLGVDSAPGEDPVSYLNRAAGNRFSAPVKHSKPTDEYPNPRAEVDIFNFSPAA